MSPRNPNILVHTAVVLAALGMTHAATVELDPAGSIPPDYDDVYLANWDTTGNPEGWAANVDFIFNPGTPTGGILGGTVTAAGDDPNISISGLSIPASPDTIVEIRIRKESADNSRLDLFWSDAAGGISPARVVSSGPYSAADGNFHVVRVTFAGELTGNLTGFRLDVADGAAGYGRDVAIDYFRVYKRLPLEWDAGVSGGLNLGGTGTWDTSTPRFWNGAANVLWPNNGNDAAGFGGTPGDVTVHPAGISAGTIAVTVPGYRFDGPGTLTLDGLAAVGLTGETIFDGPLELAADARFSGGTDLELNGTVSGGGSLTVRGTARTRIFGSNTFIGGGDFATTRLAIDNDDAFGTGDVTFGPGEIFLAALGGDRTIPNNIRWTGNRFTVNTTADHFAGAPNPPGVLPADGNLIVNGNWLFDGAPPSALALRNDLTINGVVRGSAGGGSAMLHRGDSGTLTLRNPLNDFGDAVNSAIRWENDTLMNVANDACLGAASNNLVFADGNGGVIFKSNTTLTRAIEIADNTTGNIGAATGVAVDLESSLTFTLTTGNEIPRLGIIGDGTVNVNPAGNDLGRAVLVPKSGTTNIDVPTRGGIRPEGNGVLNINADLTNNPGLPDNHWQLRERSTTNHHAGVVRSSLFTEIGAGGAITDRASLIANGGSFVNNGELLVGWASPGVLHIGPGADLDLNFLRANNANTGPGPSNDPRSITLFRGGSVRAARISGGAHPVNDPPLGFWLFNGTTIQPKASLATPFMYNLGVARVQAGGVIIDTAGTDPVVRVDFVTDPSLGVYPDGGLTKRGAGTLTLDAASTPAYTGPTSIEAGTLQADAEAHGATGVVAVFSGATLSGTGTLGGDVEIVGTLAPGASVGTLTTLGRATFRPNSGFAAEVGGDWAATPVSDLLVANDLIITASIGGPVTLTIADDATANFSEQDRVFTIVRTADGITGFDADAFIIDDRAFQVSTGAAGTWAIGSSGNDLELSYTAGISAFAAYMDHFFPGETDPAIVGPNADPDGDGVLNIGEFGYAGNPRDPADRGRGTFGINTISGFDFFTITIAARDGAVFGPGTGNELIATRDGVEYTVDGSPDLGSFNSQLFKITPAITGGLLPAPAGYQYQTFALRQPVAPGRKGFMRCTATEQ